MDIFHRGSWEPIQKGLNEIARKIVGKMVKKFIFLGGVCILLGCSNSIMTGGKAERPLTTERKSARRLLVSEDGQNTSLSQNGSETMVTLVYSSRGGVVPVSCELDSLVHVVKTSLCTCVKGTCRVGIRPEANFHGEGSFAFRLSDARQVSSKGSMKVKILPVTISAVSGDKQEGVVGKKLPLPLVVLAHNSENVPVSGVKVSWKVTGGDGKVSSCTDVSNDQGKAQCDWTLGTKVDADKVRGDRYVEASIFDSAQDTQKPAPVRFKAVVKSGPVAQLVFSSEQYPKSEVTAGIDLSPINVYPRDAYGNLTETQENLEVTLSLSHKLDGGVLHEKELKKTMLPLWKGGAFTDEALRIEKVGTYFLIASSPPLDAPAIGKDFVVIPGKATQLVFTQEPGGGTAGKPWDRQPRVVVQDAFGNKVNSSDVITIICCTSSGINSIERPGGKLVSKAVDGVASFEELSFNHAGMYNLRAESNNGLFSPLSAVFFITPGSADRLVFSGAPGDGTAGAILTPFPQITIKDKFGNTVTNSAAEVTLALGANPGQGTLSGTTPGATKVRAKEGVASFAGLYINKPGRYTLTASGESLTGDTSAPFNITAGAAKRLAFIVSPGGAGGASAVAGKGFTQQPQVAIQDDFGNTITDDSSTEVTLALGANPGQGTLSGTTSGGTKVRADNGVARFAGLSIDKSGEYTLTASGGRLAVGTSEKFNITAGAAKRLVFIVQPQGGLSGTPGKAGVAFAPQPQVAIQDAFGNTITDDSSTEVTLALGINSSQVILLGTTLGANKVQAEKGVASFAGLYINKPGRYTLTASNERLTGDTSEPFNITVGDAKRLVFIRPQGGPDKAGVAFAQQPQVAIQDAFGNTITDDFSTEVTLALGINPSQGILSGTTSGGTTVRAEKGVASFAGLSINKSGGYTLKASSRGFVVVESDLFTITHGPAKKLVFTSQPREATAGKPFTPQPRVEIRDDYENIVTDGADSTTVLTMSLVSGTGSLPAGTTSVTAASGVAQWTDLSIDLVGEKKLRVSKLDSIKSGGTGVLTADSNLFSINPGTASKLKFITQPGGADGAPTVAGVAFAQQPQVAIQDASGNTITDFSAEVTLAIGTNPGQGILSGATLEATKGQVVNGIANFKGLSINKSGEYTLTASGGGLTGESAPFNIIAGAAAKLAFIVSPGGADGDPAVAGDAFAQQPQVAIQDDSGNIVTTSNAEVTLAIGANPGGGTLSVKALGEISVRAGKGVASFAGLSIDKSGKGYTLKASSLNFEDVESRSFIITHGPAKELKFTSHPGGGTAGSAWSQQPVVTVKDGFGNTVSSSSMSITLAIGTNPGLGTLAGTATLAASSGVATFSGLSINKSGVDYTLTASGGGLTVGTSGKFNITTGDAAQLAFTTQPGGGTAELAWDQQPVVTVQDASGNIVTSSTVSITLAIGANPGQGTLSVTTPGATLVRADKGVARFAGLSIDKSGEYTLTASGGGLTVGTSEKFNITAGAAKRLVFIVQPQGGGGTAPGTPGVAGVAFTQQPKVAIQDNSGNTVTTSTAEVTLALGANPGAGVLKKDVTVKAEGGIANFSGLSINKSGLKYTLKASCPDVPKEEFSREFNIIHGPAKRLVFTSQPGGATAGKPFTTQPKVEIWDDYENIVDSGADAGAGLTISLSSGTGSLSGTTIIMASLGISSWSGLSIDAFGSKTLQVNKPDLTGSGGTGPLSVTSNSFDNAANPPPIPTGLGANARDNSVALSWTTSSDATSYNILRGTSANSLIQIATSNTNSYTDATVSNGVIYFYAVQASSARGTSASSSNIQAEPLSTPSISSFAVNDTAGVGALVLSWSASTGASSYQVKYSTVSGSASSGTFGCEVTALTCTVTGLTSGTMYYFSVNATNAYAGSVNSSESSGTPRTVPTLSLTPGDKQITAIFSSDGATSFELSYGTTAGSYPTSVSKPSSGIAIKNLVNGKTYYFKVVARFSNGSLSSVEVSATPNGPQPFVITSAIPGDAQVALVWESSKGATSYMVKYGTSSNSYGTSFTVTETASTVTGLTNGTTYYFMVTAVSASGSQDASSEFVSTPFLPTLSEILDQYYRLRVVSRTVLLSFKLGGLPPSFTCREVVNVSSSDIGFIANDALTIDGTYPDCTLSVAVKGGTTGKTTITLTAAYGSVKATRSFVFTVSVFHEPAAVYSTRLFPLNPNHYAGKAMLVRHGTNGALAEVAFSAGAVSSSSEVTITAVGTSSWTLNQTMPFSTFYSGASVFVQTWYDQSGNGNDATQLETRRQPTLEVLKAGIVFKPIDAQFFSINYKPSLDFHLGFSIAVVVAQTDTIANHYYSSIFTQTAKDDSEPIPINLGDFSEGRLSFGFYSKGGGWRALFTDKSNFEMGKSVALFGSYNGRYLRFSLNGGQPQVEDDSSARGPGPVKSEANFYIGKNWRLETYFPMRLNEIILYREKLPEERESEIQASQKNYFKTP